VCHVPGKEKGGRRCSWSEGGNGTARQVGKKRGAGKLEFPSKKEGLLPSGVKKAPEKGKRGEGFSEVFWRRARPPGRKRKKGKKRVVILVLSIEGERWNPCAHPQWGKKREKMKICQGPGKKKGKKRKREGASKIKKRKGGGEEKAPDDRARLGGKARERQVYHFKKKKRDSKKNQRRTYAI